MFQDEMRVRMRRNGRYAPTQKKLKMEPLVFIGK